MTPLTRDSERKPFDWYQTLETDGTRVYFNEGEFESWKIVEVSISGGQAAEIPTSLANPAVTAMAPDASLLLVLTMPSGWPASAEGGSLWFLPLPAGEPEPLPGIVSTGGAITSDGRVVYTVRNSLYIAERNGSRNRKLVELPTSYAGVGMPSVSADSRRIVFATTRMDNRDEIWELTIDGTNPHPVLIGGQSGLPSQLMGPKWTPDGKYLIFFAGRSGGRRDLWLLPERSNFLSSTIKPVRLTNGPLSYTNFTPSRDGKQIFAVGSQMRSELVQYNANLKEFVPYLNGISALNPSFSKDGKWVAYVSYPDHDLWRARGDGTDRVRLTYLPLPAYCPHISPDGSKVLFSTDDGTFVVDTQGGTPKKVNDTVGCSVWTPDLNSIAYASKNPAVPYGQKGTWRTSMQDLRTGAVTVLPNSDGRLGCWSLTRDSCLGVAEDWMSFIVYNFKTERWSQLYASADPPIFHDIRKGTESVPSSIFGPQYRDCDSA